MIHLERTTSDSNSFNVLTKKLDNELTLIYGSSQKEFDQYNIMSNIETVVIAHVNNHPVGCGYFKMIDSNTVELKRMFVDEQYRGKGIGAVILNELEQWAKEIKYSSIIL